MLRMHSFSWFISAALWIAPVQASALSSTFDTDQEGWLCSGCTISHQGTGGNPGGFLSVEQIDIMGVFNTTDFVGDFSASDGAVISFDAILIAGGGDTSDSFGRLSIFDLTSATQLVTEPDFPVTSSWQTFSTVLDASLWTMGAGGSPVSQSTWLAVLSDLGAVGVHLTIGTQTDTVGFDNFVFGTAPEPSTVLLLGLGLFGLAARKRFVMRN